MRSFEVITGSHPKAAAMSTKSARAAVFACACILILPMASASGAGWHRDGLNSGIVGHVSFTTTSMAGRGEVMGVTSARVSLTHNAWTKPGYARSTSESSFSDAPPATPTPTYAFSSGTTSSTKVDIGLSPADSNIAVSRTNICITTRAAFACYTKGGALVSLGQGLAARPYTATEFFATSGLPIGPAFDGTPNKAKDGRIVFDANFRRFFMDFQTREFPGRLMIAVSKSEDPRDGWWTYADVVGTPQANSHDYQKVGVNAKYLLVSDDMKNCAQQPGGKWKCADKGWRHFSYTTSALASGNPYVRGVWADDAANGAAPAVHDLVTTDAFWVHRDDDTHVSVWALRGTQLYRRTVTIKAGTSPAAWPATGAPAGETVDYGNIGYTPQNAEYRNGRIVFASTDDHTWSGQTKPSHAIHVIRLNLTHYFDANPSVEVEIDRIFGRASANDPAGSIYDYGWPAVSTTDLGDVVIGEIRSNSTTYPDFRASVWLAGQSDISPSVSVKTSSNALTEFHMAGASADPSTNCVYISQQYGATSPTWRIRVAKMLGTLYPDLIPTLVTGPATMKSGPSYDSTVTVVNQGDKSIVASQGTLRLSTDNVIDTGDTLLETLAVPSLNPNQSVPVVVSFKIPKGQATGKYYLGVMLNTSGVATEYSELNNANPFLAGNHGNIAVTVT